MLNVLKNSPKLVAFGKWFGSTSLAMKENIMIYREMAEARASPEVHAGLIDDLTYAEMGWRITSGIADHMLQFTLDHPIAVAFNLLSLYFTCIHLKEGWHYLSHKIQKPNDSQTALAESHTAEDTKRTIPPQQPLSAPDVLEATSM